MTSPIQSLWIGKRLSNLEVLSISSYIQNDHEYHLYTYDDIENIPPGTIVKDGNEILPSSMIFSYKTGEGRGSFSAFSNFFRYKLLLDKGGWWTDTDMVCLRPLGDQGEYVFATENYKGGSVVTSGLIKAPKASDALKFAWETCQSKDPNKIVWGEIGPRLVAELVQKFELQDHVKPYHYFCPLGFEQWLRVLNPNVNTEFPDDVYAIHFWNEMWRRNNLDKNKQYSPKCLYEILKKKYII